MNIFLRFPNGMGKALTLSYDDGVYQDIRLAKILSDKGIKCTFNVNSAEFALKDAEGSGKLSIKQAEELFKNSNHEVAIHTLTHSCLDELPLHIAINEILEDRKNLEKMFDTIVRGMAYPYGSFNEDVLKALECAGIAYSRTVHSTGDFDIPTDWLKLSATCHHSDPKLFKYCDEFLFNSFKKPKLFYLWGHSYEFDDDNNWEVIEKFANKMGDKSDIWYATNIEIYNYVTAYNRLIFSVETHKVYNPNAIPIWFFCDYNNSKKIIKVDAGDTIDF